MSQNCISKTLAPFLGTAKPMPSQEGRNSLSWQCTVNSFKNVTANETKTIDHSIRQKSVCPRTRTSNTNATAAVIHVGIARGISAEKHTLILTGQRSHQSCFELLCISVNSMVESMCYLIEFARLIVHIICYKGIVQWYTSHTICTHTYSSSLLFCFWKGMWR